MARRKLAAQCNPFHSRPFTDYPILHWLILHDSLEGLTPSPEAFETQNELRKNYGTGLNLIVQACLRVEATTPDDILFDPPGMQVLHILEHGLYREIGGHDRAFRYFFLRSRGQLIQLCHLWKVPMNRRYLRTQEWPAIADFAVNADILGSDFFEYVNDYSASAVRRLVLF